MIDGTWGNCLKTIDIKHLLAKEYARVIVLELETTARGNELAAEDRTKLINARTSYKEVTMPFAPHEVSESSTVNEIIPAIRKYGIKQDELT